MRTKARRQQPGRQPNGVRSREQTLTLTNANLYHHERKPLRSRQKRYASSLRSFLSERAAQKARVERKKTKRKGAAKQMSASTGQPACLATETLIYDKEHRQKTSGRNAAKYCICRSCSLNLHAQNRDERTQKRRTCFPSFIICRQKAVAEKT